MITKFDGITPGPWEVGPALFIDDGLMEVRIEKDGKRVTAMYATDDFTLKSIRVDSELVAAAPDMLARLKAMYEWMKNREWSESETRSVPGIAFRCLDKPCCPDCGASKSNGHKADCSSAAELLATEQLLGINQTEVKP